MAAIVIDLILGLFLLGADRGAADSVASWIATGLFWTVLLGELATRR